MNRSNLTSALAVMMLALMGCSDASKPTQAEIDGAQPLNVEAVENPRLAAVTIYATWCPSCRKLDPKVEAVKAGYDFPTTSFVTLDYTNKSRAYVFNAADAAGVGPAIRGHFQSGMTTGIVLLVDLDDQVIVGDLRKDLSEAEIARAIKVAANDA